MNVTDRLRRCRRRRHLLVFLGRRSLCRDLLRLTLCPGHEPLVRPRQAREVSTTAPIAALGATKGRVGGEEVQPRFVHPERTPLVFLSTNRRQKNALSLGWVPLPLKPLTTPQDGCSRRQDRRGWRRPTSPPVPSSHLTLSRTMHHGARLDQLFLPNHMLRSTAVRCEVRTFGRKTAAAATTLLPAR